MAAYYNECDPFAAACLRELIKDGLIADGKVDVRSIREVRGDDLRGFTQHHFFAGIGGWGYALRLAAWPDNRPVWTGSCPCQPFSAAGKRKGTADDRHLWPEFARLIGECRPPVVFGEQVASSLGRDWLAGLRFDMEVLGYAVGAADLCSAGVGARDIRQRLYWVASNSNLPLENQWTSSREQPLCNNDTKAFWWSDKSCICPVADGVPNRMERVRVGGNAINPWVAGIFIQAYVER